MPHILTRGYARVLGATVLLGAVGYATPRPAAAQEVKGAPALRFWIAGLEAGDETWTTATEGTLVAAVTVTRPRPIQLSARQERTPTGAIRALAVSGEDYPWWSSTGVFLSPAGALLPGAPVIGPLPVRSLGDATRYWLDHGQPERLATWGGRTLQVTSCGEQPTTDPVRQRIQCYSLAGLAWGAVTVWLDQQATPVAAVVPTPFSPLVAIAPTLDVSRDSLLAWSTRHALLRLAAGYRATSRSPGASAIVGARVVTADGDTVIEDGTVVVRGGRIVAVGQRAATPVPDDAVRIDGRGQTLVPGLWDMHAHVKQVEFLPAYLRVGITTVRDLGSDEASGLTMRSMVRRSEFPGPEILLAGFIDALPADGPLVFAAQANTAAEGRNWVAHYDSLGYDLIKVWNNVPREALEAIIAEAHRRGLRVTGHVPHDLTPVEAIRAGMDEINHASSLVNPWNADQLASPATRALLALLRERDVVVDPTLVVTWYGTRDRSRPLTDLEPDAGIADEEQQRLWAGFGLAADRVADGLRARERALAFVRLLARTGIRMVPGSDGGVPGVTLLRELELYVEAGLRPIDAIRAATSVSASVAGLEHEVGRIAPGLRADLVLVPGNPLEDITVFRRPSLVVIKGKLLDPRRTRD